MYAEAYTGHGEQNKHCLSIPQINTLIGKNGFFLSQSCDLEQFTSLSYLQLMSYLILNLHIYKRLYVS